jgi:uncharacterized protein (DUF2345 family)
MASPAVYGPLAGDSTKNISYTTLTPAAEYPEVNTYNVFGPVWLPRVYGKDLESFEVASSGKVDFTLRDKHAISFDWLNAEKLSMIKTASNDQSLRVSAKSDSMYIDMNAASNTLTIFSACNITLSNGGVYTQAVSGDLNFAAGQSMGLTATSNLVLRSHSNDIVGTAFSNITLTATNGNAVITSSVEAKLVSAAGELSVTPTAVKVFASSGKVDIDATQGDIEISTACNTIMTSSNLTATATGDARILGGDKEVHFTSASALLKAATGKVLIEGTAGNVEINAPAADFTVDAVNLDLTGTGANAKLASTGGDLTITSTSALLNSTSALNLTSTNATSVTAGNGLTATATTGNVTIASTAAAVGITAQTNLSATATSGNFTAAASAGSASVTGNVNTTLTATTGNLDLSGATRIQAVSAGSAEYRSTGSTTLAASNAMTVDAASNIAVSSAGGSISLTAASGNVSVSTTNVTVTPTGNLLVNTSGNASHSNGGTLGVSSTGNATVNAGAALAVTSVGNTTFTNNNMTMNTTGTARFDVAGNELLTLTSNKVTINGNLDINGIVNSITTTATELRVDDKSITLAVTATPEETQGALDNAGIFLAGLPNGETSDPVGRFRKSFTYKVNSGTTSMGGSTIADSPAWELRGGDFHMLHTKANGDVIRFGFRVTSTGQLELVKKDGANAWKRVAKFGIA